MYIRMYIAPPCSICSPTGWDSNICGQPCRWVLEQWHVCVCVYLKVSNVAAVSPLELVYIDWDRVGSECVYS